ncbi:hypothetical protein F6X50_00055 [Dickeya dianthicola]|uniref:hypothetical protein n=1 Tax=Dickeya dianthicola TaxID=204039 RepID=UPI0003A08BD6|nr:hypothetical protein [Dickeya dianthicola]ATO33781.1 hypothetical protein DDI_2613 [Dickeya dianthicola RNS04.9]MBT1432760.1 hypothetical protein [Dickeya dianthicola]MCA7002172.1 hypothetical protein [Dickeya dianthicola]MCI4153127.1 hypothetical protein [Dickeya dianthicola]MCI4185727.1 hypothetical protein [Dickeya dianthicola]
MMLHKFKRKAAAIAVFSLALMASNTHADARLSKPMGFKQVLVFMGTGALDIAKTEPFPGVSGCQGTLCSSDYFYTHIMGLSDSEVAQKREDAISYFNREFGIDVKALVAQKRIELKTYTGNPDGHYRLYSLAGMNLPTEGWIARDGGFYISVLDSNGIPLAGNHRGETATPLNQMYYGSYNILVTSDFHKPREIIINYESNALAAISPDRLRTTFNTRTYSNLWGEGQSYVSYEFELRGSDTVLTNGREVMTFSKYPSTTDFPDYPAFDMKGDASF